VPWIQGIGQAIPWPCTRRYKNKFLIKSKKIVQNNNAN